MHTLARVLLAVTAMAALGAAQAQEYDLSKIATMKVGDRLVVKDLVEVTRSAVGPEGKAVIDATERQTADITYEVLAVDDAGHPTEVRCTVSGATLEQQIRLPKEASAKVALADVVGTLKKAGAVFAADTTTLASGRMKSLTPPQVALVKTYFGPDVLLPIITPENAYILPGKPVAAGTIWTPDNAAIDKALEARASPSWIKARVKSVQVRLTSVKEGIAEIAGVIETSLDLAGTPGSDKSTLRGSLDIRTGIWRSVEHRSTRTCSTDQGSIKDIIKHVAEVEYKPGTGKASPLPEGLNKLRWPTPADEAEVRRVET
jgi:hypothetical protein